MRAPVLSRLLVAAVSAAIVARSASAAAAPSPASPTPLIADVPAAAPAVVPIEPPYAAVASAPSKVDERMERARFSGRRFVVELLAGAAVGSLAAYATFESMCDGRGDCLGAALAGTAVNFAVTPLAVWGVGRWSGGQGTLGWTYLGGVAPLGAFGATGQPNESPTEALSRVKLELAISTLLLPVSSALCFELSSHMGYTRWRTAAQAGNLSLGIAPTYNRHGVDGAMGQLSLRF